MHGGQAYIAAMFIETEATPNPATLKFLPGQRVMPSGTRDFASPEEAEASPLAQALFDTGEVTGVLLGADFVAVTAGPGADWGTLKPQVVGVLLDHFISQTPLFAATSNGIAVPAEHDDEGLLYPDDPAHADIVEQIKELIETRVRPAVANDGGDIRYKGFHEGVVYLQMQGACSGCPSSTATLKHGIEGLLKHYVPEVTEVRAA
jgi:Fe-S cluster biogenesis protein NfuA